MKVLTYYVQRFYYAIKYYCGGTEVLISDPRWPVESTSLDDYGTF